MKSSSLSLLLLGLLMGGIFGYILSWSSAEESTYKRVKAWRIIGASGDLAQLGKLRAHIKQSDLPAAEKLVADWIDANQDVLNEYRNEMTEEEKYHVKGAEITLETGKFPNESLPNFKK